MGIAEKLTTIAENEQRVFEAGKRAERSKVESEIQALESEIAVLTEQKQTLEAEKQELQQQYNDLLKDYDNKVNEITNLESQIAQKESMIGDLIARTTALSSEVYKLRSQLDSKYQEGYNQGYADGQAQGGGDDYLQYATTATFTNLNLFEKSEVELNIPLIQKYASMIVDGVINTTVEHLTINGSNNGTITTALAGFAPTTSTKDTTLKRITFNCDFSKCTRFEGLVSNRNALKIIDGTPIDFSSATGIGNFNSGNYCLEEIRIAELSIKVPISFANSGHLSDESIQSIINGLADLTGTTSQTLTFHNIVGARVTEEQKATITSKNWALVY